MLDLTQPSAFVTNPNGTLAGEGGAIASAELMSLSPETVRYTIGAEPVLERQHVASTGKTWWRGGSAPRRWPASRATGIARSSRSRVSTNQFTRDGRLRQALRRLGSSLSRHGRARYAAFGCSIAKSLDARLARPLSRSPSATPSRVVIDDEPRRGPSITNRFGRIVITDTQSTSENASERLRRLHAWPSAPRRSSP